MGLWRLRRAPQGGDSRQTAGMGHLERWVRILMRCTEIPHDSIGSCPGGESVDDMRSRVDGVIAKVKQACGSALISD